MTAVGVTVKLVRLHPSKVMPALEVASHDMSSGRELVVLVFLLLLMATLGASMRSTPLLVSSSLVASVLKR